MCLAIPYKVTKIGKKEIELEILGQKRTIQKTLVKIKPGDFVLLQNGIIIKKVSNEDAEETLKLISNQHGEDK